MGKTYIIILAIVFSLAVAATATPATAAEEENGFSKMVGSFNSSIKSGFSKVSKSITPKPAKSKVSDATSMWVKGNPSAKLYVTAAQTHISNGNLEDAEDMYKRALKVLPNYPDAMTGYAHLKDQQGAYGEAVAMYEKAAKAHPEDATVLNGMGLCHATHGNFEQALPALEGAVKLEPGELRYRNNIAMVLVEMGRYDTAFVHFKTQYTDAQAHYNLAYLIQKRGDKPAALKHFSSALEKNPNFAEARVWFDHLTDSQAPVAQTPVAQQPVAQQPVAQQPVAQQPVAQQPRYQSVEPSINRPRVWTPRQQVMPPQQPMIAQHTQIPPRHQSAAQRETMAKKQLNALGPATAPAQTPAAPSRAMSADTFENVPLKSDPRSMAFRPRPGNNVPAKTARVARQHSIQRLPPIEQAFGSTQSPTGQIPTGQIPTGQMPVHQLTAPPVPLPPKPTAELTLRVPEMAPQPSAPQAPTLQTPVRSATQFKQPALQNAAPLPGPIGPSAPPASGTTRAPVVYPLPPVDNYRN